MLYGIPNCDAVRRSRAWLADHRIFYTFHDFRKHGVPVERLDAWIAAVGIKTLFNRHGTTFRKLESAARTTAETPEGARQLLQLHPSLIRRPVVEWGSSRITVGFTSAAWEQLAVPVIASR